MAASVATQAITDWWARPREQSAKNWIANYQKSLDVRHRTQLAEIVSDLKVTSLLEIGCHCGPMMRAIRA